ncbi:MAG TPA: hypothetical protein VN282_07305 [Pyrinomonadaceae bacterium]|nr:hypothetical protein [Pyrinomonadaceae bacterium]
MRNRIFSRAQARAVALSLAAALAVLLPAGVARAATWKGLEPFVSKRADVERVLGAPVSDRLAEDGTLEFNVSGGRVTVFFVTPKFVASKKLPAHYEGTVLQIVLQHESAQDTPESMNLVTNKSFKREAKGSVEKYSDDKEGLFYTFVESRLKTTRYAYSMDRLARVQRGK